MGISAAVLWWEEWQLRILVLASLFVQWLLFFSANLRKLPIPSWFRSIIWLAYLGSDALAIYALATLFGRQRRQDCSSGKGNSILEVVCAPVLLFHLGGQDLITAYNIEDNELWTRHVLTAMSQVTVAIYVFCKSWPGGDSKLLLASILFFIPGILKCIEKPWALKNASINSLVSSSGPAPRTNSDRESGINSLEDYVQNIRAFVQTNPLRQARGDAMDLELDNHLPQAQGEDDAVDLEAKHQPQVQGEIGMVDLQPGHHPNTSSTWRNSLKKIKEKLSIKAGEKGIRQGKEYIVALETHKLFLDLASTYPDRLGILKSIWVLDAKQASVLLRMRLSNTFNLIYTKNKMRSFRGLEANPRIVRWLSPCALVSTSYLPWAAITFFHLSHRQAYNVDDVKVTYALFCCTAVLDCFNTFTTMHRIEALRPGKALHPGKVSPGPLVGPHEQANRKAMQWLWVKKVGALYERAMAARLRRRRRHESRLAKQMDAMNNGLKHELPSLLLCAMSKEVPINSFVGQYNLIGFFARNKRHSRKMCIVDFFNCKDFLDQHWSMKPCNSSFSIAELVRKYIQKGWEDQIIDAHSYWKFSDRRGQWTLQAQANRCDQDLGWSIRSPFDESVLLWHISTDFCFYYMGALTEHQCAAALCTQDTSNEGHGCAVWCKRSPHHRRAVRCREMSNYMIYLLFVNPEMLLSGTRRNLLMTANAELEEILKDENQSLKKLLNADKPLLMEILKCNKPFLKFFTGKRPLLKDIERGFTQKIITKVQPTENREHVVEHMDSPPDAETDVITQAGFICDAWKISKVLLALGEEKMWEVIEGVWVEMLCFSASRCRGYLHAKSLGTGPELLTYIWLLLSHMGIETLPERLQRMELSSGGGNTGATPSTSQTSGSEDPPPFGRSMPREAASAGASTSRPQEIQPAE